MVSIYSPRTVTAIEDEERVEEIEVTKTQKRVLLLAVSSDRGLCGGVNSAVTRRVRAEVDTLTRAGHAVEVREAAAKFSSHVASTLCVAWTLTMHSLLRGAFRNAESSCIPVLASRRVCERAVKGSASSHPFTTALRC